MVVAANLGFPRIGLKRELKKAVEAYWRGEIDRESLFETGRDLRLRHWQLQRNAGITQIPSNDFSYYDQVLDAAAMVGAVPPRHAKALGYEGGNVDIDLYFAMARGHQKDGRDVTAMEMTKWYDTNYHYIVPEFSRNTVFSLTGTKPIDEFIEARKQGIKTRPVLQGPVSFLLLGKAVADDLEPLDLLDDLLAVYEQVLRKLDAAGAQWVQMEEGKLVGDLSEVEKKAFKKAYERLAKASGLKLMVTTYFEGLYENASLAASLPVEGLHIDLVRAPQQLKPVVEALLEAQGGAAGAAQKNDGPAAGGRPDSLGRSYDGQDDAGFLAPKILSLGLIDGRNIWKADLEKLLQKAEEAASRLGQENVQIAPSCSLLHSPVDLEEETKLDEELKGWLSFACQKLEEVSLLAAALEGKKDELKFADNKDLLALRITSPRIHDNGVKARVAELTKKDMRRPTDFSRRLGKQKENLGLPLLPTTTIGSFPQTKEVREARAAFRRGEMDRKKYETYLKEKVCEAVRWQEQIGIDVPVHGEFERTDMVEYFGEQLSGFAFTRNGWVQSYGSRCVKPPIIYGDVSRPQPMTVRWSKFAQNQTEKPVKGMLTGPVTILHWSFVRDDQPREQTCKQIALAMRDEVLDLEKAGIKIIQIDEPALREGLPLRKTLWDAYLKWAVDSFRLASSGVKDETQIHTHMCYCEFNDIIQSIADLDADVISIETSRSAMELLDAFVDYKYPNEIGPGVYDIHSPRIPSSEEMCELLRKALDVLAPQQLWVNPDCGLKTRRWEEVRPALENMVEAAVKIRREVKSRTDDKQEVASH